MPNSKTIERAELGRLLEVVRRAVRDAAEDDLLGSPSGEEDLHHVDQLFLRVQVPVLDRHVQRVAEGLATRDDRHLVHGQDVAHQVRMQCMPGLVVGEDPLLLLADDAPLLKAGDDTFDRRLEVSGVDRLLAARDRRRSPLRWRCWRGRLRSDRRSAGRPRRGRRLLERLAPSCAPSRICSRPARSGVDTSTCRSKRPGRRSAGSRSWMRFEAPMTTTWRAVAEAVELDEELVERLVLLAVEAVSGTGRADGVELVDEHDRGRVLARLREQAPDAGRAEPGEHLDERRGALRVEAGARLVRDRLREQRLAGAGRAVEEDAFRDAARRAARSASGRAGSRRPPVARP